MKLKRILSAALAGVMCLSTVALTSCRKQTVEKRVVENVYRVTTLEKPEGFSYARYFFRSGDRVFFSYRYRNPETNERNYRTFSMALDGTDLKEETLTALDAPEAYEDENHALYYSLQNFTPSGDGTYWRTMYMEEYDIKSSLSTETYLLQHVEADGTEIVSVDASQFWGESAEENPDGYVYHYIDYLNAYNDGTNSGVTFMDNNILYILDDHAELRAKIDMTEMEVTQSGWLNQVLQVDGAPVLAYWDYAGNQQQIRLVPVDVANCTLGEIIDLPADQFKDVWSLFSGEGYSFYFTTDSGIYGYDMATGTATYLLDFLNSDLSSNVVNYLIPISADRFLTNGYDDASGDYELLLMERVPEEELVPKYILTAAIVGGDYQIRNDVIRFNRQSSEYRIQIKAYSPDDYYTDTTAEYNYSDLMQQAANALNNDMVAGQIPDILAVTDGVAVDSYISKGIFADLYPYIDADERFQREDFLTNIFEAYEVNGKLYELPTSFAAQTIVGKKSVVGDRDGWTMAEFVAWAKTAPENSRVFYEMTRDELLDLFCTNAYEEFVDPDTGACSFDSEDFKLILEYVNTLSTESFWESMSGEDYSQDFWDDYENRFRNNLALLEPFYYSYVGAIPSLMNYTFYTNEELALVGLPSKNRSGSAIVANTTYAISARSLLVDGAWEFISYFLCEEYQDSANYFPVRVSSLEKKLDQAVKEGEEARKNYEENNRGDYSYGFDNGIAVMPRSSAAAVDTVMGETAVVEEAVEPTQTLDRVFFDRAMADKTLAFLKSLDHVSRSNTKVNEIIKEEAAAYFAGQKSLDETVKLIQNRVSILVAEGR